MRASRVGLALEVPCLRGLVAAAVTAAVVVVVAAVIAPPRLPRAEDEVIAVRRGEARLARGHVPARGSAGEWTTGKVFRGHGDIATAPDEERALARLRADLELGAAELLDLEVVAVVALHRPLGLERDRRVAEVGRLRQRELCIEPADRIDRRGARADLVTLRVGDLVRHARHRATDPSDVAPLALVDHAEPALERDLLARLVHLAIVDHVPGDLLAARTLHPAAGLGIPVRILGDERDVVALPGEQHVRALRVRGWQRDRGEALLVARTLDAERRDLERDTGLRLAGGELGGERVQIVAIDVGIDAELRRLDPADLRRSLVTLRPRIGLDDREHVAKAVRQRRREIHVRLDEVTTGRLAGRSQR